MASARTPMEKCYVQPHPLHKSAHDKIETLVLFTLVCCSVALSYAAATGSHMLSLPFGLAFILGAVWCLHLARTGSAVWSSLMAASLASQLALLFQRADVVEGASINAAINGLFAYGMLWVLDWRRTDHGLQPLATAALLLPIGMLARPALLGCFAVLCLLFFLERRRGLLSTGLLVLTPTLLSVAAVLTLSSVTNHSGVAALSHSMSTPSVMTSSPVGHFLELSREIAPTLVLCVTALVLRLMHKVAGALDIAYITLCTALAAAMVTRWAPIQVGPMDFAIVIDAGAAYLIAVTPPANGPKSLSAILLNAVGLAISM